MKVAALLLAFASAAFAQTWEAGVLGGFGVYANRPKLTSPAGSAEAGLGDGPVAGAFLTQNLYRYVSGQIRYSWQRGDMSLSSGSRKATFSGDSHAIHYDWLIYALADEAKVRPFAAAGAGFKLYRGTGSETAVQPLQEVALLTRTSEWKPLVSLGAGVVWNATPWARLCIEFRDYMTPFPTRVIEPIEGGGGWVHDLVPALSFGFRF
ncbi:MAG TPA: hypothetical protein PLA43_00905 [Bryobacteraceae bacterium]|nr:hypothetical protein [Bryobacteraceae bacterium]HOQ44168.1 hypothetical protein [Bryobacteraceae bacterium]HPQ13804.1 hypothetical protein [Bryobacteraceae bacterium]HPU70486.1 hypothetical protein [Bryobacteraceae bacterium]